MSYLLTNLETNRCSTFEPSEVSCIYDCIQHAIQTDALFPTVGNLLLRKIAEAQQKEPDRFEERCTDCIYLVEGDDGEWVCDNMEEEIHQVSDDDCPAEQAGFWVSNIVWDTDGEKIPGLPTKVFVLYDDSDEEDVADYLSDIYGWCICSFSIGR